MKKSFFFALLLCFGATEFAAHSAETALPVALWEFEETNNLAQATVGMDLGVSGEIEPAEGTTDADGAVLVNTGSYFIAHHGLSLAQGENRVNKYTLVLDIKTPEDTKRYALYQTDATNTTDNEFEITNREGVVGAGFLGYSPQWAFKPGEWHRIVMAADLAAERYDVYLDGKKVLDGAPQPVDGRYSLDPDVVLILADDDGDDNPIAVSRIAIYNEALTDDDIKRVGHIRPMTPGNRAPRFTGALQHVATETGHEVILEIPVIEPEGDRAAYRLQAGQSTTLTDWSTLEKLTDEIAVSHQFNLAGEYPVSVQFRDEYGAETSWNEIARVHVNGPPKVELLTKPFLQNLRQDGITFMWETNEPVEAFVHVEGLDQPVPASYQPSGFGTFIYKAVLDNLTAGTHYAARIELGQAGLSDFHLEQEAGFSTAPSTAGPFSFAVWSDSQGSNHDTYKPDPYEPTKSMFSHMAASDVNFAVGCGDLAEDGGSYEDTRNYYLNRVVEHFGTKKPFFVAWGNHDDYRGAILRKFADMPSKNVPGYDAGYGSFSFDYAGCHFICFDYETQWPDIFYWLEDDLKASQDAKFTFLFIHEPPYCELWIDGEATMRATMVPLLEKYGVDAVFSGHTHEYERGYKNGVYYCITGGGSWLDTGEPVVKDWPHMTVGGAQDLPGYKNGLVNEYVRVRVEDDSWKAEMVAFSPDGKEIGVLDTFSSNETPEEIPEGPVVHSVYFWLRKDLVAGEIEAFKGGLESLRGIDGVEALYHGPPVPSDRDVVDDSFSLALTVVFQDKAALAAYSPDPVHQAFVQKFSGYWTRVQVYDHLQN